jgi:hypothetical protein
LFHFLHIQELRNDSREWWPEKKWTGGGGELWVWPVVVFSEGERRKRVKKRERWGRE